MEKDQAIALIKGRIMDEYRKHPQLDWADIAARKLYEQWNEYFKDNQSREEGSGKLPLSELKNLLVEINQLIAGWNATEAQWSEWDKEVQAKIYQLQLNIDNKSEVKFG